jgi:hypothetical protein
MAAQGRELYRSRPVPRVTARDDRWHDAVVDANVDDALVVALVEAIRAVRVGRTTPVLVALDGRSGTGKSTLAGGRAAATRRLRRDRWRRLLRRRRGRALGRQVNPGEGGRGHRLAPPAPGAGGAGLGPAGRLARLRLGGLRRPPRRPSPRSASRRPWSSWTGRTAAGPSSPTCSISGSLLQTDDALRHRRLRRREGDAYADDWFRRWDEAEEHYFGQVVPPESFDLVLLEAGSPG